MSNNREIIQHLLEMLEKFSGEPGRTISESNFLDFEKYAINYLKKNLSVTREAAVSEFRWLVNKYSISVVK